ncbi:MAG TPA: class I SAM-dependent methyltransferase [Streptosporangiaceae bacterium]|nr:class I SAM-dependent methyltransferase [Streptosporangiaceae bacterium]
MAGPEGDYRIYADLADWWPLISPPREYSAESAYLAALLDRALGLDRALRQEQALGQEQTPRGTAEVLDLGSGGGHVAVHLKDKFRLTLVDISEEMLAVSERLVPLAPHVRGDMRSVRLGRTFDAVLVHDAIDYIIGTDDLRLAVETAAAHCRPGGVVLFVPDYVKDTFDELIGGGGGGVDEAGRTASFSERTWDPDPGDDWVQADYEFTLRTADGDEKVICESHRLSAFSRETWRIELARAGLCLDPEGAAARAGQPALPGREPDNLFLTRKPVLGQQHR